MSRSMQAFINALWNVSWCGNSYLFSLSTATYYAKHCLYAKARPLGRVKSPPAAIASAIWLHSVRWSPRLQKDSPHPLFRWYPTAQDHEISAFVTGHMKPRYAWLCIFSNEFIHRCVQCYLPFSALLSMAGFMPQDIRFLASPIVLDTVDFETPSASAISCIVMPFV